MSTLTITRVAHTSGRTRSLSIIASRLAPILTMPAEIILDILELSITDSKASAFNLALTCKAISKFIDILLYRTVVLDSPETIVRFLYTVRSKSAAFLQTHVKKIAFTCEPYGLKSLFETSARDIIRACGGLQSLAVPADHEGSCLRAIHYAAGHSGPLEIIMESYNNDGSFPTYFLRSPTPYNFMHLSPYLTHLRISEPSKGWFSPIQILSTFGPLPHLSHLHLARRSDANEDNDRIFASDLSQILQERPALKMLAVSVFAPEWLSVSSCKESNIWKLLSDVQMMDDRLFMLYGREGEWREEWKTVDIKPPRSDFWHTSALEAARIAGASDEL